MAAMHTNFFPPYSMPGHLAPTTDAYTRKPSCRRFPLIQGKPSRQGLWQLITKKRWTSCGFKIWPPPL